MSDVKDSDTISNQDDDDVEIKDNIAFQNMYTNAQNQNETMWKKKAKKYVEDGLPEKEAKLQAEKDICLTIFL